MQRVPRTRSFPATYAEDHPHVTVAPAFAGHPLGGGAVRLARVDNVQPPQGPPGQPYMGMDPSDPQTWVRPWNPQPGMVARLNFDGAKAQGDTPMGGTWRNPQRDRAVRRR